MERKEINVDKWSEIADLLKQASCLIEQAHLLSIVESAGCEKDAINRIENCQRAISGLPYLFTPQPQWQGGDSLDQSNFKVLPPHISIFK